MRIQKEVMTKKGFWQIGEDPLQTVQVVPLLQNGHLQAFLSIESKTGYHLARCLNAREFGKTITSSA